MLDLVEIMAERSLDDVWMKFVPTMQGLFTFSASSNEGFAGRNTQWRAMVTFTWNLFEGGIRFAEMDEMRSRIREARFNRESALLNAESQVETAHSEILAAQTALQNGQALVGLARENLDLLETQYRLGVAPQTAVLDAQLQYTQSGFQILQGRLRLSLARNAYARSLGLLTLELFGP